MIPAVCWIENPVAKDYNLNQWFVICQDNNMRQEEVFTKQLYSLILIYEIYNCLISERLCF